ncbi:MAG: hypothetical protein EAX91_02275 [Candidatus Lokiarchaeota archaeon]|nr:hypothetical protein [Candidatus Lokiarchaeota archaeon]
MGTFSHSKKKGDVKKKVINCEKCGRIHALYADCDKITIGHGVVFEDDRKCYDWNCFITEASSIYKIEERILDSILNEDAKENPLLIYE